MNPPENRRNSITRYAIQEDNLVGGVREPICDYDLLSVVMICLGNPGQDEKPDVLKLLDVLLSGETGQTEKRRILMEEFDIPMTEHLEQEVSVMCNLSQGILEKGIERGIEQGIEKGIVQGEERGILRNQVASVCALMETAGISSEQAMDMLKIAERERPGIRERLTAQNR